MTSDWTPGVRFNIEDVIIPAGEASHANPADFSHPNEVVVGLEQYGETTISTPPFIVGFGHRAGVGKDTAAEALAELGYERIAFADALKAVAYSSRPEWQPFVDQFGWDVVKRFIPEVRQFLQLLGTAVRDYVDSNAWVDAVLDRLEPGHKYVVTDVRFPNEANAILERGGRVYRIDRLTAGTLGQNAHHISEEALLGYDRWSGFFENTYPSAMEFRFHVIEWFRRWVEPHQWGRCEGADIERLEHS